MDPFLLVEEDSDFDLFLQHRIDDVIRISEMMCLDNNTTSIMGLCQQLIC